MRIKQYRSLLISAQVFITVELLLSVLFNSVLIYFVHNGNLVNVLLIVVIIVNGATATRLFFKLQSPKCASSMIAFVIWKIIQEIIMVPVLVILSFILIDKYLRSWNNAQKAMFVLVIIWLYALYSLFMIIYLGLLARAIWSRQNQTTILDSASKNEQISTISYIETYDDHQFLLNSISSENIELRQLTPNTLTILPYHPPL